MTNGENFRKNFRLQLDSNPYLKGLEAFSRSLEKAYFSKVSVRNCNSSTAECNPGNSPWNLVIEMECNFNLVEILYYLEKGNWGEVAIPFSDRETPNSAFYEAIKAFRELNLIDFDVEELSIVLQDTVIVIKKLYKQSIEEQLGQILQTLAAHYVHLTRGLTETPYEIYLPVFEEEIPTAQVLPGIVKKTANSAGDYFGYWALYFDSISDARIYDLESRTIISGDLHMLNH